MGSKRSPSSTGKGKGKEADPVITAYVARLPEYIEFYHRLAECGWADSYTGDLFRKIVQFRVSELDMEKHPALRDLGAEAVFLIYTGSGEVKE